VTESHQEGRDVGSGETGEAQPARPGRGSLLIVYATVFLDLLGFGIILPFLPYYTLKLGGGGLQVGILLTSYSLAQLVGAPILGRISDRTGRRPILLLSLAGASVAMVLSGLATTLIALYAARALAGLFGGSISTAQAYVADVTGPGERAKYMGLVGASVGLGFVFGPAAGAGIGALGGGFPQAAFLAAGLAAANFAFAFFKLREPRRRRDTGQRRPTVRQWLLSVFRPGLWQVFWATFFITFAFVCMEVAFALFGKERYGLDAAGFGSVLAFVGLLVAAVQGGLVGRVTGRLGVRPVAVLGCALMGIALLLVPAMPVLLAAAGALGVLAVGQGLSFPTVATLASQVADAGEQGAILGLRQSMAAAARAVGPVAAGAIFDLRASLPFLAGGALALLAALLVAGVRVRAGETSGE
jgi:MFS family permease